MQPFKWTCPFCNHNVIVSGENYNTDYALLSAKNKYGDRAGQIRFIVCPNPECNEIAMYADLCEIDVGYNGSYIPGEVLKSWNLIPSSKAKVFPDYIPKAIKDDYVEAFLIKDLSPKASATLSRRCLQGIIRDFWGVVKKRLVDEIEGIRDKVDPLTWDAIDSIRKVGNIGAHMEADINVIIDVEANEAGLLIELIETLINDTYINKYERQQRLRSIIKLKEEKEQAKSGATLKS